jgi:acetolactate synthase-1/2/3 large subunit
MAGMHGKVGANRAITQCDLLLAIGTRLCDRTTAWKLDKFAPDAYKIHVDIDSAEINKNMEVDLPMVGDAKAVLRGLLTEIKKMIKSKNRGSWANRIGEMRQVCEGCKGDCDGDELTPERVIDELNELLDGNAIISTDVGQCQMFAAHFLKTYRPRTFLSSGGLGTMGFGLPAAIGAKVAKPEELVIDIAGDGSFTMVSQELWTSVENDIPVTVCIMNNGYLGMVRQWQELFYGKRYSSTHLGKAPDFVKLAEAYGARGIEVDKPGQVRGALKDAIGSPITTVVDFHIKGESNILPMIPPGGGVDKMIGVDRCRPT